MINDPLSHTTARKNWLAMDGNSAIVGRATTQWQTVAAH
jgi:hypothetical protein